MKSLVIDRKNWLFSTSQAGARATATWMALIESVKANDINPYDYIHWLLTNIPQMLTYAKNADLAAYLPRNHKNSVTKAA